MSILNALGEYGLNQILIKRLTTPGDAPAPGVAPEVFPGLTLENDRPEWGYLKGEIPFAASGSVAALAGNRSVITFQNPAGSNTLAVMQLVEVLTTSICSLTRLATPAPTLTPIACVACDTRAPLRQFGSALQVSGGNQVGVTPGAQTAKVFTPAVLQSFREPLVILPGGGFQLIMAADNITLDAANLYWTERSAQPGELA